MLNMASISAMEIQNQLRMANLTFVTPVELGKLLGLQNKRRVYAMLQRLESYKILNRVGKGIYTVSSAGVSDFEIANYLCQPSYVSLESALTHYGILSQFTYSITSITTIKSKKVLSRDKEFEFTRISKSLFWGYEKKDGALVACPEKAFLDLVYLTSKGLRNMDIGEMDISGLDRNKLRGFATRYNYSPFIKYMSSLKL